MVLITRVLNANWCRLCLIMSCQVITSIAFKILTYYNTPCLGCTGTAQPGEPLSGKCQYDQKTEAEQ